MKFFLKFTFSDGTFESIETPYISMGYQYGSDSAEFIMQGFKDFPFGANRVAQFGSTRAQIDEETDTNITNFTEFKNFGERILSKIQNEDITISSVIFEQDDEVLLYFTDEQIVGINMQGSKQGAVIERDSGCQFDISIYLYEKSE